MHATNSANDNETQKIFLTLLQSVGVWNGVGVVGDSFYCFIITNKCVLSIMNLDSISHKTSYLFSYKLVATQIAELLED